MATFTITSNTTVADIKSQFVSELGGGTLRVYNGRSEADNAATLVSLGAKQGTLQCRSSRTVGKFEDAFLAEFNLKVKVYTNDNWVKVLNGITLATVKEIPNGSTRAKMEEFISYKREEKPAQTTSEEVEIPKAFLGFPILDVTLEPLGWELTENELEQRRDNYGSFGAVVVEIEDDDYDTKDAVYVGDLDEQLESALEFINEHKEDYPKATILITTDFAGYGFPGGVKQDYQLGKQLGHALGEYYHDRECYYSWGVDTPALVRLHVNGRHPVFSLDRDGDMNNQWSLDKEIDALIQLWMEGKNVREFPSIPIFTVKGLRGNIDKIIKDFDGAVEMWTEDIENDGFAGKIYVTAYYTDDTKDLIIAHGATFPEALRDVLAQVNASGKELDDLDKAMMLTAVNVFQFSGTDAEASALLDKIFVAHDEHEKFTDPALPEGVIYVQDFYRPEVIQFDNEGYEIDPEVADYEIEEKFNIKL